ncbi:tail fiber assembly protein [Erwinia sp. PK3-005]
MSYWFSPEYNAFYPKALENAYKTAGTLPNDLRDVSDDVFIEYSGMPPAGKVRTSDNEGFPCWADMLVPEVSEDDQQVASRNIL